MPPFQTGIEWQPKRPPKREKAAMVQGFAKILLARLWAVVIGFQSISNAVKPSSSMASWSSFHTEDS